MNQSSSNNQIEGIEKLSVVIPMYNSESTIIDSLKSVFNQTRLDYIGEIIVVNDGSTDDSLNLVRSFSDERTNIPINIINQTNSGAASARNSGIKASKYDWIALLDSDDIWLPSKTETQIKHLRESPQADFIGSNYQNKPLRILFKKIDSLHKIKLSELCLKWYPVTPTFLFRKSMFESVNGFDSTKRYAEDGDFLVRSLIDGFDLFYSPECLVSIGHGKRSFGQSGLSANLEGMYRGNVEVFLTLYKSGHLRNPFYLFVRSFAFAKHLRRLLISFIAK